MSDQPKAQPARKPLVIHFDPPRARTVPLSAMKRATVCELAGHAWAWLNSGGQECARCGKPGR